MPNFTPSTAKNHMRRTLSALLDPHPRPEDVSALWLHFKGACAYCGKKLDRARREGHRDHLISHADGGGNAIYNTVLACATCNGNEKREGDWKALLRAKEPSGELRRARKAAIDSWCRKGKAIAPLSARSQAKADKIIAEVLQHFDDAVRQMRALREEPHNTASRADDIRPVYSRAVLGAGTRGMYRRAS